MACSRLLRVGRKQAVEQGAARLAERIFRKGGVAVNGGQAVVVIMKVQLPVYGDHVIQVVIVVVHVNGYGAVVALLVR